MTWRTWVNGSDEARARRTEAYFWAHVRRSDGCWTWGASHNSVGYGQMRDHVARQAITTHRYAYRLLVGPIPEGLYIDHLCRNRGCCNPAHLEPVTQKENVRRSPIHAASRTHCPRGHEYAGDNLRVERAGRVCRECGRLRTERKRRARGVPVKGSATHCCRGHEFNEDNTRLRPGGQRACRACDGMHSTKSTRARRETWRARGLCMVCGSDARVENRQACAPCLKQRSDLERARQRRKRFEAQI